MAAVSARAAVLGGALAIAAGAAGACGDLQGLGGPAPPLVTFTVEATGDLGPLRPPGDTGPPHLRVALVWGMQWLTEPLCILPPENEEAAAVIAAGCRDPFGFVPLRVGENVDVTVGAPATISLATLPAADVMVGDVTARAAFGSLVVYDDRDGTGTLELARPNRLADVNDDSTPTRLTDRVYGASFVTMTEPDRRVAYREGAFNAGAAFYPRAGCPAPPPGFSIVGAGGFSASDAIAAALRGELPPEDPATCTEAAPADTTVEIPLRAPAEVQAVACTQRRADSSVRYREPDEEPDLTDRTSACVHLPSFDGTTSDVLELVVTGRTDDACPSLSHFVLRGCREDPLCAQPDWDHTASPPPWWPCPVPAAR
ncbi:MAG TPA: hypothetical protein VHE35_07755 [Kofleriaceae bacterium]|nr:hypothetical protein [Kofleriaceae bacterium]